MAISSGTVWEVRSTGNANNGGGFDSSLGGTDYSQQNSPQLSLTDLACANNTTLTSVTGGFTSAMLGNYVHITSGTNFTAGYYRITAVASGTSVTLDRNPTTGAVASVGVGRVGGAVVALTDVNGIVVAGNTIYVQGSFTSAATITLSVAGGDGTPIWWVGYSTTRGDNGQATIVSTNSAATTLLDVAGAGNIVQNITSNGASLSLRCFRISAARVTLDSCLANAGTTHGFLTTVGGTQGLVKRCVAIGCGSSGTSSSGGFVSQSSSGVFERCEARTNGGNGFSSSSGGTMRCFECISKGNTLSGFQSNDSSSLMMLVYCTAYGNTLDGCRFQTSTTYEGSSVRHSIFYGNSGYGMRSASVDYSATAFKVNLEYNAFGANTLGARSLVATGANDITLTADPFLDAANNNFSLNTDPLGGALVRNLAQAFGIRSSAEASTGTINAGAVQGDAGGSSTALLSQMRSLWRELTNERDSATVTNSVVDIYLQRGLDELNRRIRYHRTTDTTTLALVAGTQEYAVPTDFVYVEWVEFASQRLKKRDVDSWERDGIQWRSKAGRPQEYAILGSKVIFYPIPDANAVAEDASPDIRYVSTPPSVSTYGPEQLGTQDWEVPVFFGASLWSGSHPDSGVAALRNKVLGQMFDQASERIKGDYLERLVAV